jgi:hypothetical protein
MAVTRIKNNQVTDASGANTQLGINANTKLQNYSITSAKIANNLTYGSDLTITGNLTVQGNTTTIDTTITTIEDPVIVLASTQTSGAPAVDIGYLGYRGNQSNIAFVWDESADEFVTAFTDTGETNTTINITSYANFHTNNANIGGNLIIGGNIDITGNIANLNVTGNITGGNLLTPGLISATSTITSAANITGGNLLTGGLISATSTITSAANVIGGNITTAGQVTATGNITGGNVLTGGVVSATANITGGNLLTGGLISATSSITTTANITGGNILFGSGQVSGTGNVYATNFIGNISGNIDAAGANTQVQFNDGDLLGASAAFTFDKASNALVNSGNITGGNLLTGGVVSATANITGGNIITAGIVSAGGNVIADNVLTDNVISSGAITITTASNGAINLQPNGTGNVVLGGNTYINGISLTPAQDNDAASKYYVDTLVSTAISYHEAVFAATTGNLDAATGGTVTYNQPNGAANGIGATLTTTGSFNLIDTANVQSANTRILVKDQANAVQNGVYVWSNATVITRSSDTNTAGLGNVDALGLNDYFYTTSGNVNKGTAFIVDAPSGLITFGTSNIQFAVFSQTQVYSANTAAGLSLIGTVFSAKVDNNTTAFDGGGNISVKAGANLTTPNIGAATGTSLSVTGNVTSGNVSTAGLITATGNVTGGNILTGGLISATSTITSASNITGGNILFGSGQVSGTGNVYASNFIGNISGNIDAAGSNTQVQFNDGDLLGASAAFTFDKATNVLAVGGQITSTGAGNAATGSGQIFLNGATLNRIDYNTNGTGAPAFTTRSVGTKLTIYPALSASTTDYALGIDTATMWYSVPENTNSFYFKWYGATTEVANISGTGVFSAVGNVSSGGNILATGNVTGANLILTSGFIDGPASGRIVVNGSDADVDFAVDGDTLANVFYVDAGTGTASFGASTQVTNSIVNFATTTSIKVPVGNTAQRPGTGVTGMIRFNTTNNAVEVYDNSAWVSVGVPVFTVIDDEQFAGDGSTVAFTLGSTQTTNSCIVSINGVVQIPTLAYAVAGTDPTCVLTFTEAPAAGDVIDVRQITTTTTVTSISNSSGNAVVAVSPSSALTTVTGDLSVTGNINLSGNVVTNQINNGTSAVQIPVSSGNVNIDVGATDNMAVFTSTNLIMTANILPSANITYNLGSTTQRWNDLWLANSTIYLGNSQISANATALIFTNPAGGQTVFSGATPAISVTGNVTGGNILTGGLISATGNVSGGNLNVTGNIVDTGPLSIITASNGNINLSPNGTGVVVLSTDLRNGQANGTGNIGSSTGSFNTVFAKATSAQYADLAEKYAADADYAPGTVVMFGGSAEVTLCVNDGCSRVAGVISTNPSYRMNDGLVSEHTAMVALTGRVPTKVTGTVRKGDMMVSAGNGVARAEANPQLGTVIGKALADSEGDVVIEVVVGRV